MMARSITHWLGGFLLLGVATSARAEEVQDGPTYRFWGLSEAKKCRYSPELTDAASFALQEFGKTERVSAIEPRRCDCLPQSPGDRAQVDLGGVVDRVESETGRFVRVRLWRRHASDLTVRDLVLPEGSPLLATEVALSLSALRLITHVAHQKKRTGPEPTLVSEGATPTFCMKPNRKTFGVKGPEGRFGLRVSIDQAAPTQQQQQQLAELRELLRGWFQDRALGEVCLRGWTAKGIATCPLDANPAELEVKLVTKPTETPPKASTLSVVVSTAPADRRLTPYQREVALPMPPNRSLAKAPESSVAILRNAVLNLAGGLLDGAQMLAVESASQAVSTDGALCAEYVDCATKKCRPKNWKFQSGLGTLVPGVVLLASGIVMAAAGRSEWGRLGPDATCDGEMGRCYFDPKGLDIGASLAGAGAVVVGGGLLIGWRASTTEQVCPQ